MFSEEIKRKAMVACGRHCCICHKFCGNNMEVHHIKAKADGGEDTFENAIPLCFDCHAEVRQYDPKHPKGIKFSEQELIQHRDNWYKIIQSGNQKVKDEDGSTASIKIYRQKDYQNIHLSKISSGQELLAIADKTCALEYSYDEPQTEKEAKAIADIGQVLNDVIDFIEVYQTNERILFAYELNDKIKELDKAGFWLFLAIEKRVVTGGIEKPECFPTLLARVVRKGNPGIIKVSGEKHS